MISLLSVQQATRKINRAHHWCAPHKCQRRLLLRLEQQLVTDTTLQPLERLWTSPNIATKRSLRSWFTKRISCLATGLSMTLQAGEWTLPGKPSALTPQPMVGLLCSRPDCVKPTTACSWQDWPFKCQPKKKLTVSLFRYNSLHTWLPTASQTNLARLLEMTLLKLPVYLATWKHI